MESLLRHKISREMIPPPFDTEADPEAHVREGLEELALGWCEKGAQKKTLINIGQIQERIWEPPMIAAEWLAPCQGFCDGIEG